MEDVPRTLDTLFTGAGEVFTAGPRGPLNDTVVGVSDGRIAYIGNVDGMREAGWCQGHETQMIDLGGRLLTPGLVECHTHLVFGGDRSHEYAQRAAGDSYLEIAAAGGGIAATMRATRAASPSELFDLSRPRLDRLLANGVTTAEVKSGYGLSMDAELKTLRVVKALDKTHPIELVGTFLGAHSIPPELRGSDAGRVRYLDEVVEEMIPAVRDEGLAEFCDVFVERGAFTVAEGERVLGAGLDAGLVPKVHADQLSSCGGAELAARLGAVSADHLEFISDAGIQAMADAGVVAVLLPGAALFLGTPESPPARTLIQRGVDVALSTDCNPGTCMTENLLLMLTLGMSRYKMTPREVLEAVTVKAAKAIGRADRAGVIAVGRRADLAVFDVPSHRHLPYHFGVGHTYAVYIGGKQVYQRPPLSQPAAL